MKIIAATPKLYVQLLLADVSFWLQFLKIYFLLSIKINIKKSTNSDNVNMAGGRKLQIFSQHFRNLANVTFNNVHNTLIFNFVHFVWRHVLKYAKSYNKKRFLFTSKISNYVGWQKGYAFSLFIFIALKI